MAPLLPERFMERPRLFNKILTYLLKKDRRIPVAVTQHLNMVYEQKGVLAFDAKNATERNQAVAKTIAVSLDLLDASKRPYYMELAIFPEDTEIPFTTISQLWGLSLDETEQLLQSFNNLALLKLHFENKTIRLHDELHFYLNVQPIDIVVAHQKLIASWGNLEHLPDEYAWRYLAYHLINSKQPAKLQQLLCDPLWLHLKLANTDIYGLIADFDYFQADQDLSYIQRALQLSTHVLAKDPNQFVSQLYGRLIGSRSKVIQGMLKQIETETKDSPWLRSMIPCLISPDSPLIRTLTGHSGSVNGVAVTPDGRRAVSASEDHTLKVWDLESGRELCILTGHSSWVHGVAVTPDGYRAVSASVDNTLKVWDLKSSRELCTLTGHSDWVLEVAVTPDGRRAVSASSDSTLKVWDLKSGKCMITFTGEGDFMCCTIANDGKTIIAGDKAGRVYFLYCEGV
jgi:hypothetical protein